MILKGVNMAASVEEARKGLSEAEIGGERFLPFEKDQFPKYLLIPGDPGRISTMANLWENAQEFNLVRGFRAAIGSYHGIEIGAVCSGIGGPSMEHVLTESAALGVHTYIRVGTTGAIQEGIQNGDLIIDEASVRLDGTSHLYVQDEYPASASYEVTLALVEAAERLGVTYHVGIGCTTASFFAGQGRASFGGYKRSNADAMFMDMQRANVLNFEMEGAALLTLARLFRVRAGMVATVIAQRITGAWGDNGGIERACRVASEAIHILAEWDQKKAQFGKRFFFPGLLSK